VGSGYGDPERKAQDDDAAIREAIGDCYSQVILGFVLDGNSSRWLTNDEISAGVIKAIEQPEEISIVGSIEPWERRP
jgi:hypothetical protein